MEFWFCDVIEIRNECDDMGDEARNEDDVVSEQVLKMVHCHHHCHHSCAEAACPHSPHPAVEGIPLVLAALNMYLLAPMCVCLMSNGLGIQGHCLSSNGWRSCPPTTWDC